MWDVGRAAARKKVSHVRAGPFLEPLTGRDEPGACKGGKRVKRVVEGARSRERRVYSVVWWCKRPVMTLHDTKQRYSLSLSLALAPPWWAAPGIEAAARPHRSPALCQSIQSILVHPPAQLDAALPARWLELNPARCKPAVNRPSPTYHHRRRPHEASSQLANARNTAGHQ